MNWRTAGFLVAVLAVVCVALVSSVAYPTTTSEPHSAEPAGERFAVEDADAFSATGSVVVDGEVRLAFEGVVTADGAWYQTVRQDDVISEEYRPAPNETVYERFTIEADQRAERLLSQIAADEDRRLVREGRDGDRVTVVAEVRSPHATEPVSGAASVVVRSLFVVGYEAAETSSSVTTYEPRAGWYPGREAYRVTEASGVVRADADTHAVNYANVSWGVTVPAGTYAEYVLAATTSDDPTAHRITFEFDPGDHVLEQPAWVDDARTE